MNVSVSSSSHDRTHHLLYSPFAGYSDPHVIPHRRHLARKGKTLPPAQPYRPVPFLGSSQTQFSLLSLPPFTSSELPTTQPSYILPPPCLHASASRHPLNFRIRVETSGPTPFPPVNSKTSTLFTTPDPSMAFQLSRLALLGSHESSLQPNRR